MSTTEDRGYPTFHKDRGRTNEARAAKFALDPCEAADRARYGPHVTARADGKPRMTDAQRDALWRKCGDYNVPFREDDYLLHRTDASFTPGFAEGWIGGNLHAAGNPHATIYVGVDPEGRINS